LASRHRYGNRSNKAALSVARAKLQGDLTADVWQPIQLGAGEHIRRHLGARALLVSRDGRSGDAVVESNVPLEVKDGSGQLAPVELALADRGSSLESTNPIVPVRYFKDARRGFSFERTGIGVHPEGAPGPAASAMQNAGSKPFFANVAADTDFWVTPRPAGAQARWQLRSQSSPEVLTLDLDLPAGATLRLADAGYAEVVQGQDVLAFVSPPAAVDASGQQVPVRYEVQGSKLRVIVSHRAGDFMYPIVVDPDFSERYDWVGGQWPGNPTFSGMGDWKGQDYGPFYMFPGDSTGVGGAGLYILGGAVAYTNGQWAEWYLDPWRAHITIPRAEFQTSQRSQSTCTYTGIWTNPGQYRHTDCTWYDGYWDVSCLPNACSAGGSWDNIPDETKDFGRATFGYYKLGAGTPCCTHWTVLRRSLVYYWDYYAPTVDVPDVGSRDWAQADSVALTGSVNDRGIGLADEHVTSPGADPGTANPYDWSDGCAGTRANPCLESHPFPSGGLTLDTTAAGGFGRTGTGAYREGRIPIDVNTTERIGRSATKRVAEFKIDRTNPNQAIGGTLHQPDGSWIGPGTYTLTNAPTDALSGVQRDQFTVGPNSLAGDRRDYPADATSTPCDAHSGCPTNPPSHDWSWTVPTGQDGPHQITAATTDPAGNTATQSWSVGLDTTAPTATNYTGSLAQHDATIGLGHQTLSLDAADAGSGVKAVDLLIDGNPYSHTDGNCTQQQCDKSLHADLQWDSSDSSGRLTVTVRVTDLVGNQHDDSWQITVEATPPIVMLSGSLYDARDTQIGSGEYGLQIHATDGDPAFESRRGSGVQSVEVLLDGDQQDYADQPCHDGNCALDMQWTLDTSSVGGGAHLVEVVATDQFGYTKTESFSFTMACCLAQTSGWSATAPTDEVRFGDVNGDGAADQVTRDKLTGTVTVRLANGSGFDPPQQWGSFSTLYDLHVADVNGDGNADLVGRDAGGNLQAALSTGEAFLAASAWGSWDPARTIDFADIDGDGAADVVGRDPTTGDVSVGYSDGEASFEGPLSLGTWADGYTLSFVDVDGDQRADAVGRNPSTGDTRVAVQSDSGLQPATSWGSLPGNYDVTFGDVNGDTLADVVARDRQTGDTQVMQSDGTGFGAPASWGTWDPASDLQTYDLNGDGRLDIVGTDMVGNVRVAPSTAPTPPGPPADDPAPADTTLDSPPAALPPLTPPATPPLSDQCPAPTTTTAGPHKGMMLAYQDDGHLLQRDGLINEGVDGPRFTTGEPKAICAINHLYDRARQSGASLVRFNVYWGRHENATNPDGTYAGGTRYYWDKLDRAVDLARANGFRVELTITGAALVPRAGKPPTNLDCNTDYNPNGRGCANNDTAATGEDPSPTAYRAFVQQVVHHFTHDPANEQQPLVRADYFSIWNEPNTTQFLRGSSDDEKKKRVPVDLYGQLYAAGYRGYLDGLQGVTGTRILIGELSSGRRSGRGPGAICVDVARGKRRCFYPATDFLQEAAKAASTWLRDRGLDDHVVADGVALHPYQHDANPWSAGYDKYRIGIGNLHKMYETIKAMCSSDGTTCKGSIRRPDGRRPLLYLTEFGYLSIGVHQGTPLRRYHRETVRATRFAGSSRHPGALAQALKAGAQTMLIYELAEHPPPVLPPDPRAYVWDSGVIGQPLDYPSGDADIVGCRPYGKPKDGTSWKGGSCSPRDAKGYAQDRKAYCAIRRWAASTGFFDKTKDPYVNACG
jgi:hypothetical protein